MRAYICAQGYGYLAGAGKRLMKAEDMDIVVSEVVRKTTWVFSECAHTAPMGFASHA